MSAMHMNINRSKRSVTLDLKRPERARLRCDLIETADVFVHSMRTSAARRLGIDYASVAARNPRIVYGYAPGYMPGSSRENDPAFDDVLQGESGIADLMLKSVGQARYLPTVMVDKFCGHALASAVGMALFSRERTGLGQQVCVPMFETLVAFNLQEHLWGAAFDPPLGTGIGYVRLLSEHRRPYETRDSFICVLAVNDEQWKRLLPAIGRPELVDDERFRTVDARIRAHRRRLRRRRRADEAADHGRSGSDVLDAIDIPNGAMASFDELLDDPYLNETGFIQRYTHPTEGPMVTTQVPTQFSATPAGLQPAAGHAGPAQRTRSSAPSATATSDIAAVTGCPLPTPALDEVSADPV